MATHNAFVQSKSEQQAGADVPQSARETEDEWKTVLQTVLRLPNAQETLAVVLFLLDTLAFLRSMIDASMRERDDRSEVVLQFMAYLRAMVRLVNTTPLLLAECSPTFVIRKRPDHHCLHYSLILNYLKVHLPRQRCNSNDPRI